MKNIAFLFAAGFIMFNFAKAQNVNIPDANFKAYLVGNTLINTNGDNQIQVFEAAAFTGTINANGKNIANATGIEAFVKITTLNIFSNQLTSLDVSKNTALQSLSCHANQITSLDVSKNTALQTFYCYNNRLTNLDVSKNTELANFACDDNMIPNLDVSKNTALQYFTCSNNRITNLDVSKNTLLTTFYCSYNQITNLDVSKSILLRFFDCISNHLTNLNLKNGNNAAITSMRAHYNQNLTCIQVDNIANANTYMWSKDTTASYNTDCTGTLDVTNTSKKEIKLYPNPAKDLLHFSEEISNIKVLDTSGKIIREFSTSAKSIDVAKLPKGGYIISGITKTGQSITRKIIKQ